jgi:O-methyltransferase
MLRRFRAACRRVLGPRSESPQVLTLPDPPKPKPAEDAIAPDASRDERFQALTRFGRRVLPEYRFTWYQLGWWDDPAFSAYLGRFGEKEGFNAQRRWAVYQFVRLTAGVPGDTAECGVFQGAGSYLLAAANRAQCTGSLHHAFDSFAGLSAPTERDGTYWAPGALASPLDATRQNLAEFGDAVRLYAGWIPERFPEVAGRTFRFVHIDVDLYEPTLASLEFFYPRVPPGGIILCDDYLFTTCPGATEAVDQFLASRPEKMVPLPDGAGFFIKGVGTGEAGLGRAA